MNNENMNYEKAKVFLAKNIRVHIVKTDGTFYNGLLTEVGKFYLFIEDRKEGNKLVLFQELKEEIEEFTEVQHE